MKQITRRQVRAWLAPMRRALCEIKSGEVDSIQGYAVTRMNERDDYARLDYCIHGFVGLLKRLTPDLDASPAERLANKLAAGTPVTVSEVDGVFALLKRSESHLVGLPMGRVMDAVMTEQVAIEFEQRGLIAA